MEIGQHILKGRVEKLTKGFLMVEKIDSNLQIKGYIKSKIIFNTRTQPKSCLIQKN